MSCRVAAQMRDPKWMNQLVTTGIRDKNIILGNNELGEIQYLDSEGSYNLVKNRLLQKDSDFMLTHRSFAIEELDGIRQSYMSDDGEKVTTISEEFKKDRPGAHFGDMTDREFSVMLYNLYGGSMKKEQTVTRNGKKVKITLVPQLVTIMESSKASDVAWMPVITGLYKKGELTDTAVKLLLDEVLKEASRIQRVAGQILVNGKPLSPEEIKNKVGYLIEDYHTGENPRALEISDKTASLLPKALRTELEKAAKEGRLGKFLADKTDILKEGIKENYTKLLEKEWKRVQDTGEIITDAEGRVSAPFLNPAYKDGNPALDFVPNEIKDNMMQAVTQAFINTMSLTEIMYGDQSYTFKNDAEGADAYKRNKTANAKFSSIAHNASIPSLKVTPFQYSNVAIMDEPEVFSKISGKSMDEADAQMWGSVQAIRNSLFGLGRLTADVAEVLDKIERGETITPEDIFDGDKLKSRDMILNSFKFVFRDGSRTLKLSMVPLTKALTSYNAGTKENPEWKAIPGWEKLHELRESMEAKGIDFVAPKTASKTLTINKLTDRHPDGSLNFSKLSSTKFNNNFFGLQLEVPSNKVKITTPTQLLHAIDIEQKLTDANGNPVMVILPSGKEVTLEKLRDDYQKAVADKSAILYNSARNEMYDIKSFNADIDLMIARGAVTPRLASSRSVP